MKAKTAFLTAATALVTVLSSCTTMRYGYQSEMADIARRNPQNTLALDTVPTPERPWANDPAYKNQLELLQDRKDLLYKNWQAAAQAQHDQLELARRSQRLALDNQKLGPLTSDQRIMLKDQIDALEENYRDLHRNVNSSLLQVGLNAAAGEYELAKSAFDLAMQHSGNPKWAAKQAKYESDSTFTDMQKRLGIQSAQQGSLEQTRSGSYQTGVGAGKEFTPVTPPVPFDSTAIKHEAALKLAEDSARAAQKLQAEFRADSISDAIAAREEADALFKRSFRYNASQAVQDGVPPYSSDIARAASLGLFNPGADNKELQEAVISAYLPIRKAYEAANRDSSMTTDIAEKHKNGVKVLQMVGLPAGYAEDLRAAFTKEIVTAARFGDVFSEAQAKKAEALGMFEGAEGDTLKKAVGNAYSLFLNEYDSRTGTPERLIAYNNAEAAIKRVGLSPVVFIPAAPKRIPAVGATVTRP